MSDNTADLSAPPDLDADGPRMLVNLDGFEGPLDLLLTLARTQKVDLLKLSIAALADQYLAFIAEAKRLRLDVAAEYLVAAAWLAYLKSRLLLPKPPEDDEPSGEDLAAHLAFQLKRLEAMREAAERLMARDRLGRDIFPRGAPETVRVEKTIAWRADLAELLRAYAHVRTRDDYTPLHLDRPPVCALETALGHLRWVIGEAIDWRRLEAFLPPDWRDASQRRSGLASAFAASLELAKEGKAEIRQDLPFGPIRLRAADREAVS